MTKILKRVALITEGSCGLGLGIAEQLAADGFVLAIHGRRVSEDVTDVVERLQGLGAEVLYCQADVADADSRQRMVEQIRESFGRLDVLVNNAAASPTERPDILEATEASFTRLIDVNLKGPYFLTQRVAGWMIKQRQSDSNFAGVIVNVLSANAELATLNRGGSRGGNRGVDFLSKAGVSMATKLWAIRLAEYGIQVYEVRPGIFRTDRTDAVPERCDSLLAEGLALPPHSDEPRRGDPAELGRAVKLLVGGELYATGNVLTVDGGMALARL